jgi:hypothetical protein
LLQIFAGASPEINEWLVAICEGGMIAQGMDEEESTGRDKKKQRPSSKSKGGRASSLSSLASTRRRIVIQYAALSECAQVLKYASKCLSEPCEEVSGDREFNSSTARDLCKRLLEYATHYVEPRACEILAEVMSLAFLRQ